MKKWILEYSPIFRDRKKMIENVLCVNCIYKILKVVNDGECPNFYTKDKICYKRKQHVFTCEFYEKIKR